MKAEPGTAAIAGEAGSPPGPKGAERESAERHLRFAVIVLQFAALVFVVRALKLETPAFGDVAVMALCAFVVHHFLPLRAKMPFFALVSVASVLYVLGLEAGTWLLGTGTLLIILCHVPAPFAVRVALVLVAAALLVSMRAGAAPFPGPAAIWPILGSMFMFRLMVYLYDLKHAAAPFGPARAAAYFFMMPNVCFPLFPVVDYKTFCRGYYNDDALRIYSSGVRWIFRGVIHLLLYRLVSQWLVVDPTLVRDAGDLFQSMCALFLLYLRVSGSFHVIVGMLHLFGFNLPETHHLYLLSSSISEFWRRINIYWRDFIMKLVFYPVYFRLKSLGPSRAMIAATLVAFLATWALHAYQWFWLRGTLFLVPQDMLFWGILGILVAINAQMDLRRSKQRTLKAKPWTLASALGVAARTVGTFVVILMLWFLWSADSPEEWASLMSHAGDADLRDLLLIGGVLGAIAVASIVKGRTAREWTDGARPAAVQPPSRESPWRTSAACAALLLAVLAAGRPQVRGAFGPEVRAFIETLTSPMLNPRDVAMLTRGYYEDLMDVQRFNPQLSNVLMRTDTDWGRIHTTEDGKPLGDVRHFELAPLRNINVTMVAGAQVPARTNRWGLRDREYEQVKDPATYRIAFLGASIGMGWGVRDGEAYEQVLEDRLNQEGLQPPFQRVEILNFSVYGYGPISRLLAAERKAFEFQPDALLIEISRRDLGSVLSELRRAGQLGLEIPHAYPARVVREAGIRRDVPPAAVEARLRPHATELVRWAYGQIVAECRKRGVKPIFLVVPSSLHDRVGSPEVALLIDIVRQTGELVLDASGVYAGVADRDALQLPLDLHPSAEGHRVIAAEAHRQIRAVPPFAEKGKS